MATCRDIIKGAMKKLAVLPIGREPTAAQAEDALDILEGTYRELVGQGVFGRLTDVLVTGSAYAAREQERVVCQNGAGVTVTLPDTITAALLAAAPACTDIPYGAYPSCCPEPCLPRPPYDGACIVVADLNSCVELYYVYDANRALWAGLDHLTLDMLAPLSGRYENGLKAKLAVRLASGYGRDVTPLLQGEVNGFHYQLAMKNDRRRLPVMAEYF